MIKIKQLVSYSDILFGIDEEGNLYRAAIAWEADGYNATYVKWDIIEQREDLW